MTVHVGRVLQFDEVRGYGFIAADSGGDDVFLHASVFEGESGQLVPGTRLEFKIMEGDRGRKAFAVRLAGEPQATASQPDLPAAEPYDGLCDVLSQEELHREVTELLLEVAPTMTGGQLLEVRRVLTDLAKRHGWIDG